MQDKEMTYKERHNIARIEHYQKRKCDGKCTNCGDGAREGKTKCSECAKKEKVLASKSRGRKIRNGACVACGGSMDREGSLMHDQEVLRRMICLHRLAKRMARLISL